MTSKKKDDDKEPEKVLGPGAFGSVEDPAAGAPVSHEQFEPAPVDAPESVEKEKDK